MLLLVDDHYLAQALMKPHQGFVELNNMYTLQYNLCRMRNCSLSTTLALRTDIPSSSSSSSCSNSDDDDTCSDSESTERYVHVRVRSFILNKLLSNIIALTQ